MYLEIPTCEITAYIDEQVPLDSDKWHSKIHVNDPMFKHVYVFFIQTPIYWDLKTWMMMR